MFHVIQNTCLLRNRSFSFVYQKEENQFLCVECCCLTHTPNKEKKRKEKLQHWATTGQPKETTKH